MSNPAPRYSFLQGYTAPQNSYNEICPADGELTSDWNNFFSSLRNSGIPEIQNRTADIHRLLKENGVAYNIYNDPSGKTRPWELDPIPQIIAQQEWDHMNAGLIQRAQLFNLLLKDIYGPQTLIREGLLPQELIYMHPGFLRPAMNINLPAGQHLVLYSADLGRGMDGRLWIISDRTQAPSGYGYALENRFVMSNVLPELFSNLQVKRLSPYFDSLQQALNSLPVKKTAQPRIVILTAGPENETYFEHSYLSAYLGITLVEGNDLMVKDNFVWLKTIDGLEKVDVILRRMDDIFCDPLELKSDSVLGVPGLLQVVRKGNVAIANPLGSSIIENAGLMPFLNNISRHFLGEDLIIPSIATWWCGQPKEKEYVINNLEHLVVRRIFRKTAGNRSATDGASLTKEKKKQFIREIEANPQLFCGQEKINFSSTPSLVKGKIKPGHSLIRSFLVKSGDSYVAMPGGLTRTSYAKNSFIISNQTGGVSKDTWVISSGGDHVQAVSLQLKNSGTVHSTQKSSLPSHTAENLFWSGRHTERVINNARLLRTVMQYLLQNNYAGDNISVVNTKRILLQTLTHCTYAYPGFLPSGNPAQDEILLKNPWPELTQCLYDENKPGSLKQNLSYFKRAVYNVRNFLSQDTWRIVQQIDEHWTYSKEDSYHDHIVMISDIDNLNASMFSFLGMSRESAKREQEWAILDLGKKFEQALFIIRLLQNVFSRRFDEQTEYELLSSVLNATQSMVTYRYTYRDHLQLSLLNDLLVLDVNYPKSLAYLTERIKTHIFAMPKPIKTQVKTEAEKLILEAVNLLNLADGHSLSVCDSQTSEYRNLKTLLDKLNTILLEIDTLISKTYFKHTISPQQLYVTNIL